MRIIVCVFAVSMIIVAITFCFLPVDFAAKYAKFTRNEQALCLLKGLGLENTVTADTSISVSSPEANGGESAVGRDANDNSNTDGITTSDDAENVQPEEDVINAVLLKLQTCPRTENGEIDFRALCFTDRMTRITGQNFSAEELEYVFSKVVQVSTVAVPVSGVLTKFAFIDNGNTLEITAEINLDLRGIIKKYRLSWLPQFADFSITVPLVRKNTEIEAKCDDIKLKCTSFNLPNSLLLFGCYMAFGKADYQTKLGVAVSNVLNNLDI